MVKTLYFHCRGAWVQSLVRGTTILHALPHGQNKNKQKSLRNSYLLNKRINKLSPCLLPISKAQPQTVRVRILLEERGGNVILSDLPKLTGTKTDCDSVGKGLHTIPRKLHI